ncbi:hypothetical protein ACXYMU_18175 [Pontibacter sp. CAU 1760]
MKRFTLPAFICFALLLFLSTSCRQDGPAPIRNVKAGPKLLKAQASAPFQIYTLTLGDKEKFLGNVFTQKVVVSFENGLTADEEQRVLAQYSFLGQQQEVLATSTGLLHGVKLADGLNANQVEQALQELALNPKIAYAAPYFLDGNALIGMSDEVEVRLLPGQAERLGQLAQAYKAQLLDTEERNVYLLKVNKYSKGNALALANYLNQQEGIAQAIPDFIKSAR